MLSHLAALGFFPWVSTSFTNLSGLVCAILVREAKSLPLDSHGYQPHLREHSFHFSILIYLTPVHRWRRLWGLFDGDRGVSALLGYRFGIFCRASPRLPACSLYLGQTTADWPSAPILTDPQLSPTFSIFDLNFLLGWYVWVALGSNVIANFIGSLQGQDRTSARELQELNQYMTERV